MKKTNSPRPSLNEITTWTRQAGDILCQGFDQKHLIEHKGEINLVTEMDRRSEQYLIDQIRHKFPDHAIVTEESGQIDGDNDHCWYIDPLDGTTNYTHKMPIFSVSMAYAVKGKVILGVVYDPMRRECFTAMRGRGAWINQVPIYVSKTDTLIQSLLCTGFSSDDDGQGSRNVEYFAEFQGLSQGVRRLGSAALDLCYVAVGRLDGFWEMALHAWDIAAGALLVEEAGGVVTGMDGEARYMVPPYALVAGNPAIHSLMLEVIRSKVPG